MPEKDTQTGGLMTALLAVQAEVPTLPKDGRNPHFNSRFTPLDTIVETVGPILSKHGLVWMTLPCRDEGGPALKYRLAHAGTGEAIEGVMPLKLAKDDMQALGSALTYGRRYALSAVLNLVADEDDDGNTASRRQETASRPANDNGNPQSARLLSDGRMAEVIAAIKRSKMPPDWTRMQLVALGVADVPEGPIMQSTIRALTEEQATSLIATCDQAVADRVKA